MAPIGLCRLLLAVNENRVRLKEDAASLFRLLKVVGCVGSLLLNVNRFREKCVKADVTCFCASIINIAVSSELGYGPRGRKRCLCGSDRGLEASPFTAGTSIESGDPPSPSSTLARGHERRPPPREQRGTTTKREKRRERDPKEKLRKLDASHQVSSAMK